MHTLVWSLQNLLSEPWFPEAFPAQDNRLKEERVEAEECIFNKMPTASASDAIYFFKFRMKKVGAATRKLAGWKG